MKDNKTKGQAMVETLLITVFATFLVLAGIQLAILIMYDLTYNEAGFAASRTAMVTPSENRRDKVKREAISILSRLISPRQSTFSTRVISERISSNTGDQIEVLDICLDYNVRIIFGKFFSPLGIDISYIRRKSNSRIIPSPDPEYYNKAYPNGPRFYE
ncbi:hypothetical protein ACFL58_04380 [Elusimicrobiota bacterium]